jgi:hypothetical protein
VFGAALIVAGLALLLPAFVGFAVEGIGTPAPAAPTSGSWSPTEAKYRGGYHA